MWITNDLPPRAGGIQQFVANLLHRVHPEGTLVLGPSDDDTHEHDERVPWETVRAGGGIWPTPRTRRHALDLAREHQPDVIVLGASWPLGELAGPLRRELDVPVVALSHGLEAGLAGVRLGGLLRRATRDLELLTTISDYTEHRLRPHVRADRIERVPPGVDIATFHPALDGSDLRRSWGVPDDVPLVGCVSRLVKRKGQDQLLDVWPEVQRRHPDAWLAIVGTGPLEDELRDRAASMSNVVVTGRVAWEELPKAYAALDLFAMPCRTRLAGTDVEGLGIVYLEAAACGVPAIAGRSGGAPEAVRDGETGAVVDGRDAAGLIGAIDGYLADPALRAEHGRAGRRWVEETWSWTAISERFEALLDEVVRGAR